MRHAFRNRLLLSVLGLFTMASLCYADVTLALNKTFVKRYKDRATLTTNLHVDEHPTKAHNIDKSGDDGDIHMAGRDSVFKLPLVAEIINARLEPTALQRLMETIPDQAISVTGVWRIWFEHLGSSNQIQGQVVPVPTSSNPDHLCEIHPITKFSGVDCLNSFVEIKNENTNPPKVYEAYIASKAFPFYDSTEATIKASNTAIMIASGQSKYNYTEFYLELAGSAKEVSDGYLVLANVYDADNSEDLVTSTPRRMVFVKGTAPADKLLQMTAGSRLHVLGIPRVNLSEVSVIANANGANEVTVNLPYEMIIAAVLL